MDILQAILNELKVVAFEQIEEGRFRVLQALPQWLLELYFAGTGASLDAEPQADQLIDLGAAFPFLDNFLADAEPVWSGVAAASVKSGIWTETDTQGGDYPLEAHALLLDGRAILLISNLSDSFAERQRVYQTARELALSNDKLLQELNMRQRQLQDDIEQRLQQDPNLSELAASLQGNPTAVLVCQPNGSIELINQSLIDIYRLNPEQGLQPESLLNKWVREAELQYPEMRRVLRSGAYWEGEFESTDMAGHRKWIRLAIGPVMDGSHALAHYVCVANDISALRQTSLEFEKLSDIDFTTRLPNRRTFWKQIAYTISTHRAGSEGVALLYVDIDHFKRVNDDLGHQSGDLLLNAIASRLLGSVKKHDFVAHLGGDEFAIIISRYNAPDDIVKVASRLLQIIHKPIALDNGEVTISASIGVALHPKDGRDAALLMKHADMAMYYAKELGRNQFQFYNARLDRHLGNRLQLQHELNAAIEQRQFLLLYQPQICIGQDSRFRLEALVRWQHPRDGVVSPGEFIGIAEETGMIVQIGAWVLDEACRQARLWIDHGVPILMAVNISTKQFQQPNFPQQVQQVLQKHGLPPQHLELEVTENVFLDDFEHVARQLKELRRLGVSISLDDFGSGYSSLKYLKQLPVDILKIDRSFIQELPHNPDSNAITVSVIGLAHQLGIKVVAEGVETEEQLAFLEANQVDYVQGYLFFFPLPAEKILEAFGNLAGSRKSKQSANSKSAN